MISEGVPCRCVVETASSPIPAIAGITGQKDSIRLHGNIPKEKNKRNTPINREVIAPNSISGVLLRAYTRKNKIPPRIGNNGQTLAQPSNTLLLTIRNRTPIMISPIPVNFLFRAVANIVQTPLPVGISSRPGLCPGRAFLRNSIKLLRGLQFNSKVY
jgi:hypothetical protein